MEIDDFLLIFQKYNCLIHFNIFISAKVRSPTISSKLEKLKNKETVNGCFCFAPNLSMTFSAHKIFMVNKIFSTY